LKRHTDYRRSIPRYYSSGFLLCPAG